MIPEQQRLGIIGPSFALGTVPSLQGMVCSLTEHGYGIDLYTCDDAAFVPPSFPGLDVRIFMLPEYYRRGNASWWWQLLRRWVPYLAGRCQTESYGCLIGIDPLGLLLASVAGRFPSIPVVYWSLEILFWNEITRPHMKVVKLLERLANRTTVFTVIQDWDRAILLAQENRIPRNQIEILPNAPPGKAQWERSDHLRNTLGIAYGRSLVLYLGSIVPWAHSLELAQQAKAWHSDAALVFHSCSRLTGDYAAAFRQEIDGHRTYLSEKPVASDEVRRLAASADIGVALYPRSTSNPVYSDNTYVVGRSSGKIAHYLQCGTPVIASALPSVQAYIEGYKCGVCIDDIQDVSAAVETILADYPRYSANALACFLDLFDINSHFAPIFERLEGAITARRHNRNSYKD